MTTKTTNHAPLHFIDANILFLNPENPRSDMGDLSELVASIQAHGILQPLLVRQEDGAYKVIDGSCRLAAGLQAGLTAFPCLVTMADDDKAMEMAVTANIIRKEMSPLDEIRAVERLTLTGESHAAIAARFGRTARWVATRRKIANMPSIVLDKIAEGKLSIADAEILCKIGDGNAIAEIVEESDDIAESVNRRLRELSDAPWVNGKSECAKCLLRSDKQASLFDDGGPARCMDERCWEQKRNAWKTKKEAELRAAGHLPKESYHGAWQFENSYSGYLLEGRDDEEIAELVEAGVKPRYHITDENEVLLRYYAPDMPEKTEKTSSSDDVPEAEELPEDEGEDVHELREELEECVEEGAHEEEDAAPVRIPQWQKRKEYADRMRDILREKKADDIRDTSLLRFVAEAYRASTSGVSSLDALNDGKCILACNIDDIKRALLVDIVGEFVASESFQDDAEAVGYWEQFKSAFGITEEKEVEA